MTSPKIEGNAQRPSDGQYSCASCGMFLVEPCVHWRLSDDCERLVDEAEVDITEGPGGCRWAVREAIRQALAFRPATAEREAQDGLIERHALAFLDADNGPTIRDTLQAAIREATASLRAELEVANAQVDTIAADSMRAKQRAETAEAKIERISILGIDEILNLQRDLAAALERERLLKEALERVSKCVGAYQGMCSYCKQTIKDALLSHPAAAAQPDCLCRHATDWDGTHDSRCPESPEYKYRNEAKERNT